MILFLVTVKLLGKLKHLLLQTNTESWHVGSRRKTECGNSTRCQSLFLLSHLTEANQNTFMDWASVVQGAGVGVGVGTLEAAAVKVTLSTKMLALYIAVEVLRTPGSLP